MDVQTLVTLRCTACGVLTPASCNCRAPQEILSPAEAITRRRENAAKLYKDGLTQAQVADKLNVKQQTVSDDLRDLPESGKLKHPKSATNPKGAGRPKGSKSKTPKKPRPPKPPGVKQAQRSIDLDADTWEQVKLRAAEANMPAAAFIGVLLTATINPEIDLTTLSKTAQNKVGIAIRQHQKKLDYEFEQRVRDEYTARVKRNFPDLDKMQEEARCNERLYREYLQKAKKAMTVAEYTLVCSLLHPDSRTSASEARLMRAFQMFEPKKFALTGEK